MAKANPAFLLGVFLLVPYAVGFIFLQNFQGGTFQTADVFFGILATSGLFLYIAYDRKINPAGIKWFDRPEKKDLKYIVLGFFGVLAVVYLITPIIPGSVGILVALIAGGGVLMFTLYKSETVIVPWIAHAAYNVTAVVLSSFSIVKLAASPIVVPTLSAGNGQAANLLSQILFQTFAVSIAEEMLKISVAFAVGILVTKDKRIAFAIAVILWAILHTVQSYRLVI